MTRESGVQLAERIQELGQFQQDAHGKLQALESELDKWLEEMCSANVELRERLKAKPQAFGSDQTAHAEVPPATLTLPSAAFAPSLSDDYKVSIEKLLQGSMEALGDKLSDKILGMLKELKTMAGPMREAKMMEIHNMAQAEHVDLAALFLHEKVESNLGKDGLKIEEKKTKGIGSILDKLKKLKGGE